jgi:hypothetical protein
MRKNRRPATPRLLGAEMSTEVFIPQRMHAATLGIVEQANAIIAEYLEQGFTLTLRQLFYQMVARALLENTSKTYKRLGVIVRDGRNAGLIDWNAIEDRVRVVNTHSSWDSPADIIETAAHSFKVDWWENQLYRPEVWIEKNALIGVIEGICTDLRVPYFATIGNNSQTLQYQAGKRFAEYFDHGLTPIVLHLADHDPNGIDMTRDVRDRLALYARRPVEVRRGALTMEQIEQYNPPPNFAKEADTRFNGYIKRFGTRECWELDALNPTVISDLIRTEIERLIGWPEWDAARAEEVRGCELLRDAAKSWSKVENLLRGQV